MWCKKSGARAERIDIDPDYIIPPEIKNLKHDGTSIRSEGGVDETRQTQNSARSMNHAIMYTESDRSTIHSELLKLREQSMKQQ